MDVVLILQIFWNNSTDISSIGIGPVVAPATIHKISTVPNVSTASFTSFSPVAGSARSSLLATASNPMARISSATISAHIFPGCSLEAATSLTTTFAPSFASKCAAALPIPLPPPVTIATLPLQESIITFLLFYKIAQRSRKTSEQLFFVHTISELRSVHHQSVMMFHPCSQMHRKP